MPSRFRRGKFALPVGLLLLVAVEAGAQVRWRSADPQVLAALTPGELIGALDQLREPDRAVHVIAQLSSTPAPASRDELRNAGLTLLAPLGGGAFFASVDAAADLRALATSGTLEAVAAIEPAHKLHPLLAAGAVPDHVIVRPDPVDPIVAAYVVLHRDVPLAFGVRGAEALGAVVRDRLESINGLVLELPLSRIEMLARRDEVQWIEPALPRLSPINAENRLATTVEELQQPPFDLDGAGVTVLVYDSGTALASHADFAGSLTLLDASPLSDHTTHVSGTVGGRGVLEPNNRGMAPATALLVAGFEYDGTGIFLYTNPGDIESDYQLALQMGADLANNSIGTNTEVIGFPCSIQGDYGVTAAVIDAIVGGSLGTPIPTVWGGGNERQGSGCDIEGFGDFYSTAPPAGAKATITVGAINANDETMTTFSSWGPTDDGRLKPDVTAPGCEVGNDDGVTSTSSFGGYTVKCGTSVAAPTVTGICALILQDHRVQFPSLPDPLPSTMKMFLVQTAKDLGAVGPDYRFGYGSVQARAAVEFMRSGQFTEQVIDHGAVHAFDVEVEAGLSALRFTLAWSDPPGTPNVEFALVNDLDLRVINPAGAVQWPFTLDPLNPQVPAKRIQPNTLDPLEQVWVQDPIPGTWRVEVVGTSVPEGPQVYSLGGVPGLEVSFVSIGLNDPPPALVAPQQPVTLDITVTAVNDTIVPDSELLYVRVGQAGFVALPLMPRGGNDYTATIAAASCGTAVEFYLTVMGVESGPVFSPAGGATAPFSYEIGEDDVLLMDDFESDLGWVVTSSAELVTGAWERGVPAGGGDRGDPAVDGDGSGQCYLTDNVDGDHDVDQGTTTLTSPTMDASGGGVILSYYRWFAITTNGGGLDTLVVEISDDDGASWTVLETIGPTGPGASGGWFFRQFDLDNLAGFVANDQFRIQFTASDTDPPAVVEAAVDGVSLSRRVCPACPDTNGDGLVGSEDLLELLASWGICLGCPADTNGDGQVDTEDLLAMLAAWGPC